jgi:nicotinamide-nucleotide amidase
MKRYRLTQIKAEIISIGTELLLGDIINTNASYLSRELAGLGIELYFQSSVGDNPERLAFLLRQAIERSDIVITTGGLGPTVDDITLETIARVFPRRLILDNQILHQIKHHFQARHLKMPPINKRQALIPEGAIVLENRVGTAPGIILEQDKKILIALPGPPLELKPIFEESVIPFLKKKYTLKEIIFSRTLKLTGLAESEIAPRVADLLRLKPPTTVGIYAHPAQVDLKITAKETGRTLALRKISGIEKIIRRRLGKYIFGKDGETLEEVLGKLLLQKKKTLAIAESCSGGLISNRITNVSGSSRYFLSSVIAYSNKAKINFLKVPSEVLRKFGAVSKETAKAMARNIRDIACSDIGIGVTGIAGPTGGSTKKPVGLVYIALSTKDKIEVKEFRFSGDRVAIKFKTSQAALEMVRRHLLK